MRLKYLFLVFALVLSFSASGQDLHFTQFQLAPMNLNPALTGAYLGSYRVGGLYRDQYRSVSYDGEAAQSAKPYQTVTIFADSPIIGGFRKQDWIGIGGNFYFDQAGGASLRNIGQLLSVAYHLGIGKKAKSVFTLGAQFGAVQRRFDKSSSVTPYFLETGMDDPILAGLQADQNANNPNLIPGMYTHWNIGTMFTSELNKRSAMRFGVSVAHFLRPGQAISGAATQDRRNVRTTGFLTFYNDIGDKFTFIPSIMFQNSGSSNELVLQTRGALLLNEEKEISLTGGLGFRVVNASDLQVMVGMDYKDIRVGLAYDINLASFTPATNGSSGFELGVTYLGKIYKKPKIKPLLICPRL